MCVYVCIMEPLLRDILRTFSMHENTACCSSNTFLYASVQSGKNGFPPYVCYYYALSSYVCTYTSNRDRSTTLIVIEHNYITVYMQTNPKSCIQCTCSCTEEGSCKDWNILCCWSKCCCATKFNCWIKSLLDLLSTPLTGLVAVADLP